MLTALHLDTGGSGKWRVVWETHDEFNECGQIIFPDRDFSIWLRLKIKRILSLNSLLIVRSKYPFSFVQSLQVFKKIMSYKRENDISRVKEPEMQSGGPQADVSITPPLHDRQCYAVDSPISFPGNLISIRWRLHQTTKEQPVMWCRPWRYLTTTSTPIQK